MIDHIVYQYGLDTFPFSLRGPHFVIPHLSSSLRFIVDEGWSFFPRFLFSFSLSCHVPTAQRQCPKPSGSLVLTVRSIITHVDLLVGFNSHREWSVWFYSYSSLLSCNILSDVKTTSCYETTFVPDDDAHNLIERVVFEVPGFLCYQISQHPKYSLILFYKTTDRSQRSQRPDIRSHHSRK